MQVQGPCRFPSSFSLKLFLLMFSYFHASFASSQTCLIAQNKGTQRISAPAHFPILTFSQLCLCNATTCSCTINRSAPHPGCPEAGRTDVLYKKHDLKQQKNVSQSPGVSCGYNLGNATCERETGSGQGQSEGK